MKLLTAEPVAMPIQIWCRICGTAWRPFSVISCRSTSLKRTRGFSTAGGGTQIIEAATRRTESPSAFASDR